jgi:hypothetical protein
MSKDYLAVLRCTNKSSPYNGVVTWTSFESKTHFDQYLAESTVDQEVVAQGVTEAEAINFCSQTPRESYARVAFNESLDPETGALDEDLYRIRLGEIAYVEALRKERQANA